MLGRPHIIIQDGDSKINQVTLEIKVTLKNEIFGKIP